VQTLALTFDDGPDPVWTTRLLDRLQALDARVTFFPIAARAAAHPRLIERIRRDGHAIGLHCDQHVRHGDRDPEWLRRDTRLALAAMSGVGVRPSLWRTPWGDRAPWSEAIADEHGLRLVGWTADTHDWRGDTAEQMLAATQDSIEPGAIVLAHDGIGPGSRRDDASETLRYVELVAEHACRRRLAMEALG
jgi:peptidoglycan/xylan/chitin deacetylase (PgdA/CDA1 family)